MDIYTFIVALGAIAGGVYVARLAIMKRMEFEAGARFVSGEFFLKAGRKK